MGLSKNNKNAVISTNNLCILNNKSSTYLNLLTGSYSAIDLCLCDPVSYMDYGWKVHNDLCGSDHFPRYILIECRAFAFIKKRFFKVNSLFDLFENVKMDEVLSLQRTRLYQKYDELKPFNQGQK